jgi:hypothetical protein
MKAKHIRKTIEMATDMDLNKLSRDLHVRLELLAHLACSLDLSELTPGRQVRFVQYDTYNCSLIICIQCYSSYA